jgi:hypothetical protein
VNALPDDAAGAKTEIAKEAVDALPDGDTGAKTEIATTALGALPEGAMDAKKEVVNKAAQGLSSQDVDALIARIVTVRRVIGRVLVWTIGGALAVALIVAISAAIGTLFLGTDQAQNLLRVITPVTALLFGYLLGAISRENRDIDNNKIHEMREELHSLRQQQADR